VPIHSFRFATPLAVIVLASVAACRDAPSSRDSAARDALQRDLELAQASSVALATRDLPPTRFVSALEAGERTASGSGAAARPSRKSPKKAPRRPTPHAAPAVSAVAAATDVEATAGTESTPAPAPATTTVASDAGSAPAPEPVASGPSDAGIVGSVPSDTRGTTDGNSGEGRRGRGIGGIFGGIIGVVIRGGGVGDDDHCERDHPRGGRVPPIGIGGVYGGYPTSIPASIPRSGRIGGRIGGRF
jgi:hypothetical protein